jgi:multisubunit Na+/H+ antiporter MnhB subunit
MNIINVILIWIGMIITLVFMGVAIWVGITEEKIYYYSEREEE